MSAASNAVNPPIQAMTVKRIRREEEEHAAEHVNAGGHHRRGVNQRADGRRAFHRVGQPDVQRELGGLAHRAAEDQQAGERGRGFRAPADSHLIAS